MSEAEIPLCADAPRPAPTNAPCGVVFVVIPTFNQCALVLRCLDDLKRQTMSHAVIVADGGSSDGTVRQVALVHPSASVVVTESVAWWTGAAARGADEALRWACDDDFLLFLNNDVRLSDDYIATVHALAHERGGAGSGVIRHAQPPHDVLEAGILLDWTRLRFTRLTELPPAGIRTDVAVMPGYALLVPVGPYRRVGGLRPDRFPHHMADYDLTLRLRRAGIPLVVSSGATAWTEASREQVPDNILRFRYAVRRACARRSKARLVDHLRFAADHAPSHLRWELCAKLIRDRLRDALPTPSELDRRATGLQRAACTPAAARHSVRLHRLAAWLGSINALVAVGLAHLRGVGTQLDRELGERLLLKAFARKSRFAAHHLARLYRTQNRKALSATLDYIARSRGFAGAGPGPAQPHWPKIRVSPCHRRRLAARLGVLGVPPAELDRLGNRTLQQASTVKEAKRARHLYRLAAAMGHDNAMVSLGLTYLRGPCGLHKQPLLGSRWLWRALYCGNRFAPLHLAQLIERRANISDAPASTALLRSLAHDRGLGSVIRPALTFPPRRPSRPSRCRADLAPVALFACRRPWHTAEVLRALRQNLLADRTQLIVFIDGPPRADDRQRVAEVRALVDSVDGFGAVEIVGRESNAGIFTAVVDGVSRVLDQFGRAIVLEDDVVAGPLFLWFMNQALNRYRAHRNVFSLSGYRLPPSVLRMPADYPHGVFFSYRFCSWAWATWRDRWRKVDWTIGDLGRTAAAWELRSGFNQGGDDLTALLTAHVSGRLSAWDAVFDYAHYQHGAFALQPCHAFANTIGHDGTGINVAKDARFGIMSDIMHTPIDFTWPSRIEVDQRIAARVRQAFAS